MASTPTPALDLPAAVATLERALAYSGPLQRRTEGLTWILFGLATALLAVTSTWLQETGRDPELRWLAPQFAGYALLALGLPLLSWRIAGAVRADYAVDAKRVVVGILVLAVFLVAVNAAVWTLFNGNPRLSIALVAAFFGGASWSVLGLAQWSRMTAGGRRLTLVLGGTMVLLAVVLAYALGADAGAYDANLVMALVAFVAPPTAAGVWRLVRA